MFRLGIRALCFSFIISIAPYDALNRVYSMSSKQRSRIPANSNENKTQSRSSSSSDSSTTLGSSVSSVSVAGPRSSTPSKRDRVRSRASHCESPVDEDFVLIDAEDVKHTQAQRAASPRVVVQDHNVGTDMSALWNTIAALNNDPSFPVGCSWSLYLCHFLTCLSILGASFSGPERLENVLFHSFSIVTNKRKFQELEQKLEQKLTNLLEFVTKKFKKLEEVSDTVVKSHNSVQGLARRVGPTVKGALAEVPNNWHPTDKLMSCALIALDLVLIIILVSPFIRLLLFSLVCSSLSQPLRSIVPNQDPKEEGDRVAKQFHQVSRCLLIALLLSACNC